MLQFFLTMMLRKTWITFNMKNRGLINRTIVIQIGKNYWDSEHAGEAMVGKVFIHFPL